MDNMASAITDKPVESGVIAHTEVLDNEMIETLASQATASSTKPGWNHVSYYDMFLDIPTNHVKNKPYWVDRAEYQNQKSATTSKSRSRSASESRSNRAISVDLPKISDIAKTGTQSESSKQTQVIENCIEFKDNPVNLKEDVINSDSDGANLFYTAFNEDEDDKDLHFLPKQRLNDVKSTPVTVQKLIKKSKLGIGKPSSNKCCDIQASQKLWNLFCVMFQAI